MNFKEWQKASGTIPDTTVSPKGLVVGDRVLLPARDGVREERGTIISINTQWPTSDPRSVNNGMIVVEVEEHYREGDEDDGLRETDDEDAVKLEPLFSLNAKNFPKLFEALTIVAHDNKAGEFTVFQLDRAWEKDLPKMEASVAHLSRKELLIFTGGSEKESAAVRSKHGGLREVDELLDNVAGVLIGQIPAI